SGKTTLLRTIIKHFGGKRRVIYYAANRLVGPLDIEQLLFKRFGFITQMLKIKSKNMILLLDEADHLTSEDISELKNAYKRGYFKSIVFCAPKFESLKLPAAVKQLVKNSTFALDAPLTDAQVLEIVRRRLTDENLLTDDIILRIYKKDQRMRSFLKNCEVFMRHMSEQKRKTAKVSDVDKILATHKY
ncbi:MAG TPA: ATP-binding protein, partial [Acidobacteriota bacterium]|nr:ATP-binding protein [Acidobacteriota bacterium]